MLTEEHWIALLKYSDLVFCPYSMLKKKFQDPGIMNGIAIDLLERFGEK
jgi:hypothetical protein